MHVPCQHGGSRIIHRSTFDFDDLGFRRTRRARACRDLHQVAHVVTIGVGGARIQVGTGGIAGRTIPGDLDRGRHAVRVVITVTRVQAQGHFGAVVQGVTIAVTGSRATAVDIHLVTVGKPVTVTVEQFRVRIEPVLSQVGETIVIEVLITGMEHAVRRVVHVLPLPAVRHIVIVRITIANQDLYASDPLHTGEVESPDPVGITTVRIVRAVAGVARQPLRFPFILYVVCIRIDEGHQGVGHMPQSVEHERSIRIHRNLPLHAAVHAGPAIGLHHEVTRGRLTMVDDRTLDTRGPRAGRGRRFNRNGEGCFRAPGTTQRAIVRLDKPLVASVRPHAGTEQIAAREFYRQSQMVGPGLVRGGCRDFTTPDRVPRRI